MDRFVGQARLEWWANHATCLEKYDIDITVSVDAVGTWRATGRHANALDTIQREGWDFLMEMDPHFSIVFPGEESGGILVRVLEVEDGTLTLTEASDGRFGDHHLRPPLRSAPKDRNRLCHPATASGMSPLTDLSE